MGMEQYTAENGWCIFDEYTGKIYAIEKTTRTTIRFGGKNYTQFYERSDDKVRFTASISRTKDPYSNRDVYTLCKREDAQRILTERANAAKVERLKMLQEVTGLLDNLNLDNLRYVRQIIGDLTYKG